VSNPLADTAPPTAADPALEPVPGGLIAGRYRVERCLGQGGMGAVYAAVDLERNQPVAVKVLAGHNACDREFLARFAREARTTGALDHPAIVKVFEVGRHGTQPFLVMERLEGETLASRLDRGPLAPDEALAVLEPLVDGLAYLHREKIIHRDVKPANVMLGDRGRVTLMDFGLVRGPRDPSITRDGFAVGTPGAMAPEQILGDGPVDGRADQYALGAIAFEMFAGRMPFLGLSDVALLRAHIDEPVPDPRRFRPELPAPVAEVILRAMAKRPDQRFDEVTGFLAALKSALALPEARPSSGGWLGRLLGR